MKHLFAKQKIEGAPTSFVCLQCGMKCSQKDSYENAECLPNPHAVRRALFAPKVARHHSNYFRRTSTRGTEA